MIFPPGVSACSTFRDLLSSNPDLSTGVAAIRTLMVVLKECKAGTLQVRKTPITRHNEQQSR